MNENEDLKEELARLRAENEQLRLLAEVQRKIDEARLLFWRQEVSRLCRLAGERAND